jgi:hypothetical protein
MTEVIDIIHRRTVHKKRLGVWTLSPCSGKKPFSADGLRYLVYTACFVLFLVWELETGSID